MGRKFALIGHPLGHSLSPQIHMRLFKLAGYHDDEYNLFDLTPQELEQQIDSILNFSGFNITIPYKTEIPRYLDSLDEFAGRYKSVNTVKCGKKNIGYNTDAYGFLKAIESMNIGLNGKTLILGCGGVGRMMAIEAALNGSDITLAIRESDRNTAEILADEVFELAKKDIIIENINNIKGRFNILINSTPVGMYPNINACPVSEDVISCCGAVYDAIYNPVETLLVKTAKSLKIPALGGMSMLVWQAAEAHRIWDESSYEAKDIFDIIHEMEALIFKNLSS